MRALLLSQTQVGEMPRQYLDPPNGSGITIIIIEDRNVTAPRAGWSQMRVNCGGSDVFRPSRERGGRNENDHPFIFPRGKCPYLGDIWPLTRISTASAHAMGNG